MSSLILNSLATFMLMYSFSFERGSHLCTLSSRLDKGGNATTQLCQVYQLMPRSHAILLKFQAKVFGRRHNFCRHKHYFFKEALGTCMNAFFEYSWSVHIWILSEGLPLSRPQICVSRQGSPTRTPKQPVSSWMSSMILPMTVYSCSVLGR